MSWTCQYGHENSDPAPGATGQIACSTPSCQGYMADDDGDDQPSTADAQDVECDPEQPPGEAECPGPHVEEESDYKIDESTGKSKKKTSEGHIHVFPLPTGNTNSTDRPLMPKFMIRKSDSLEKFPGAKSNGMVHPAIVQKLTDMLAAMKKEGVRIDDKALQEVYVKAPWRDPAKTGAGYLKAVKMYLKDHNGCHKAGKCVAHKKYKRCPKGFEKMTFPASLEKEAKSELGKSGSTKWKTFRTNLGKASGWTAEYAEYLLGQAKRWKAPAGGSNHHSGLVVDLDWPIYYEYYDKKAKKTKNKIELHGLSSSKNEWGRKSSVGVWINKHAASFGFKSYSEKEEIWHMEFVDWKGTTAEPK